MSISGSVQKFILIVLVLFIGLTLCTSSSSGQATNDPRAWSRVHLPFRNEEATTDHPVVLYSSLIARKGLPPTDSPDIQITPLTNVTQSENSVFVSPLNDNIVLNSNNSSDYPTTQIFGASGFVSTDGGLTWNGSVNGTGGTNGGDPAVAIGLNGRFYNNYIASDGGNGTAYSTNSGAAWTHVQVASNPGGLADKNHMWVDNSPASPHVNTLYAAWTDFGGVFDSEIMVSRSTNGGLTWSPKVAISTGVAAGSHNQGVNVQTGPNGEVYATWAIYDAFPGLENAIGFSRSMDGGTTWQPAVRAIANIKGIRSQTTDGGLLGGKDMRTASFPSMSVNMQNGHIYVVWTNIGVPGVNTGAERDVYMSKSTDGGATWGMAVRVNQDAAGNGKDQWFPWISCDPVTGFLVVAFYDSRDFVANDMANTYVALSRDGGSTWEDFRVSDAAWSGDGSGTGFGSNYAGDYIGIAARNGRVYPVWTDRRASDGRLSSWVSPFLLADPIDPNPPTNVRSFSDFSTPTSIALTWTNPTTLVNGTPITPFVMRILRDGVQIAETPGTGISYNDTGLLDGTFHAYSLRTRLLSDDSLSSGVQTGWTAGGAREPSDPKTLTASGTTATGFKIRWTNPSTQSDGTRLDDFSGIRLYRDATFFALLARSSLDTGRVDSTLDFPAGGLHSYYVTAVDNETPTNESTPSNTAFTPLGLPFVDTFPVQGTPNPAVWISSNIEVNDLGDDETSAPFSMNLNGNPSGGDTAVALYLDLTGQQDSGSVLAFFYQPRGNGENPDLDDSLFVEFRNSLGEWIRAAAYQGLSTADSIPPYTFVSIAPGGVPPGSGTFFFSGFQFRFRTKSTIGPYDDWFIDDVFFGVPTGNPNMAVAPRQISDTLVVGNVDSTSYLVTITNNNPFAGPLVFSTLEDPDAPWLSARPPAGSVSANGSMPVRLAVDFSSVSPGNYVTRLIVSGNDTANVADTVNIAFVVNPPPQIGVIPDSLSFVLNEGDSSSRSMTISNSGLGDLHFRLDAEYTGAKGQTRGFGFARRNSSTNPTRPVDRWGEDHRTGENKESWNPRQLSGVSPNILPVIVRDSVGDGGPVDFQEIRGQVRMDTLTLELVFAAIINPMDFGGYLGFDTDENFLTGIPLPFGSSTQDVGCEYYADLFSIGSNYIQLLNSSGSLVANVPATIRPNSVEFSIPLTLLGNDDGQLGIASVVGNGGGPTDWIPDIGHGSVGTSQWLSITPAVGVVPPGGSRNIAVLVRTDELDGGILHASVLVSSNDPITPLVTVPVHLTVIGTPNLVLSDDTLAFGSTFVGYPDTLALQVSNNGSDTLRISGVSSGNPVFTALGSTVFSVPPRGVRALQVRFLPTTTGPQTGLLTIASNDPGDPTVNVVLTGTGTEPPQIGVTPDSLSFTVNEGDSAATALTISNAGLGPLSFQIDIRSTDKAVLSATPARPWAMSLMTNPDEKPRSYRAYNQTPDPSLRPPARHLYSGSQMRIGISDSAEIMPLQSPLGVEHLEVGGYFAGYTLAYFDGISDKVHWSIYDERSGTLSGVSYTEIEDSPSRTLVEVVLRTTDNEIEIRRRFSFVKSSRAVALRVFVKNISSSTLTNVVFKEDADWDIDGDYADDSWNYDSSHNMIYAYDLQYAAIAGKGQPDFATRDGWYYRNSRATIDERTPATQFDGFEILHYELGDLAPGEESTLDFVYAVGASLADLQQSVDNGFAQLSDWLSVAPNNGTVTSGGSQNVDVRVRTGDLDGGTYHANILVNSNDPLQPTVVVPVRLTVIGKPNLVLSDDTLAFGDTFVSYPDTVALQVSNNGSDTLRISGVSSGNPVFTALGSTVFSVPPRGVRALQVRFLPTTTGPQTGLLTIASNDPGDPTVNVVLTGTGTEPPQIGITPDSLAFTVNEGDSATATMTIANSGLGLLSWQTSIVRGGAVLYTLPAAQQSIWLTEGGRREVAVHLPPQIALLADLTGKRIGVTNQFIYVNIAGDLTLRGATVRDITFPINQALLDSLDVLAVDDAVSNAGSSDLDAIRTWLQTGKALLLQGDDAGSMSNINALLSGSGITETDLGNYFNAILTNTRPHPSTQNVDTINATSYGSYCTINSPAAAIVFDDLSRPHVAVSSIGSGKIMAVGNEFSGDDNLWVGDTRLFANQVFDWLTSSSGFLSVTPDSGVVASGGNQNVEVKVRTGDLDGGTYRADILVNSNDPATPLVTVPVRLTVIGTPNLVLSDDTLAFGDTFMGYPDTVALQVSNNGSDTLRISGVSSSNPVFTALGSTVFTVAPRGARTVRVRFLPTTVGPQTGLLVITSNDPSDPTTNVFLHGNGIHPPIIGVDPDSLSFALSTGDSALTVLTISNTGLGDLTFNVAIQEGAATPPRSDLARDFKGKGETGDIRGVITSLINRSGILHRAIPIEQQGRVGPGSGEMKRSILITNPDQVAQTTYGRSTPPVIDVAVLCSAFDTIFSSDVRSKLLGTGFFSTVSVINIAVVTPTLIELQAFDAVLVYSDGPGYHNSQLLGDVLADYVDAGGGVVCATFATASLPFQGRFSSANYWAIPPSSQTQFTREFLGTVHDPFHPILQGVQSFDGGSASFRQTSFAVASGATRIVDWTDGRALVATKVINHTNRADLGFFPPSSDSRIDLWEATTDGDLLMANSLRWVGGVLDWISVDPSSGSVQAGGSMNIGVTVKAGALECGQTYYASIRVNSNDPATPDVIVPVALRVVGASHILVSRDTLEFTHSYVGFADTLGFLVTNAGCDTLRVLGMSSTNAQFSVIDPTVFSLTHDSSKIVRVQFLPTSAGQHEATLSITSNDSIAPTYDVTMLGNAFLAPTVHVHPDSLLFTVDEGDSATTTMTIANSGPGSLSWQTSIARGAAAALYALRAAKHSIWLTEGGRREVAVDLRPQVSLLADLSGIRIGITDLLNYDILAGDLRLRGATVSEIAFPVNQALLDSLDVIAVDDAVGGAGSSDLNAIRTWLQNGKGLLLQGDDAGSMSNINALLSGSGITETGLGNYFNAILTNIQPHPSTQNIDTINASGYGSYCTINSPAAAIVFDDLSRPHVAVSSSSSGRIVAVGNEVSSDFNLSVGDTRLFINQVMDWLTSSGGFLWVTPDSGTVASGDSQNVVVTVRTGPLDDGTYHANILVSSNDPLRPTVTIPVRLDVITDVPLVGEDLPTEFALYQNYPNPFNPSTIIRFGVPQLSDVTLKVFDILGREVVTLVSEGKAPGRYEVEWDTRGVSSGVYLCRLQARPTEGGQAGSYAKTRKMILLR